nr:hypothetical protein [Tanacetum cinerariifolium]
MAWLDYDEHVDSLSMMDNKVGVTSPKSTTKNLLSFKEYTLPVTYPEEVEMTLGAPIEVEPLNKIKLEELGLNCNHNTPLSSKKVPIFDGSKPQPLLNSPSFDVLNRSLSGIAFGGNTHDVRSLGEEMDKTTNPHQQLLRISPQRQRLEMASQNTRDAVTFPSMMVSQDFTTASARTS